jgi:hypothetical protein
MGYKELMDLGMTAEEVAAKMGFKKVWRVQEQVTFFNPPTHEEVEVKGRYDRMIESLYRMVSGSFSTKDLKILRSVLGSNLSLNIERIDFIIEQLRKIRNAMLQADSTGHVLEAARKERSVLDEMTLMNPQSASDIVEGYSAAQAQVADAFELVGAAKARLTGAFGEYSDTLLPHRNSDYNLSATGKEAGLGIRRQTSPQEHSLLDVLWFPENLIPLIPYLTDDIFHFHLRVIECHGGPLRDGVGVH